MEQVFGPKKYRKDIFRSNNSIIHLSMSKISMQRKGRSKSMIMISMEKEQRKNVVRIDPYIPRPHWQFHEPLQYGCDETILFLLTTLFNFLRRLIHFNLISPGKKETFLFLHNLASTAKWGGFHSQSQAKNEEEVKKVENEKTCSYIF